MFFSESFYFWDSYLEYFISIRDSFLSSFDQFFFSKFLLLELLNGLFIFNSKFVKVYLQSLVLFFKSVFLMVQIFNLLS